MLRFCWLACCRRSALNSADTRNVMCSGLRSFINHLIMYRTFMYIMGVYLVNVKPVVGFEGIYEVSDCGSLFRVARGQGCVQWKRLKPCANSQGYFNVSLCKNGKAKSYKVHAIVAAAFIPNINGYREINHIDGNKFNNHVNNLEWCDSSHNNAHAHRTGLNKVNGDKAMREVIGTHLVTGDIVRFHSIGEARRNGFHDSTISACCKGKRPNHSGYQWQYA